MSFLHKQKDDVSYIDPKTMEVECRFNECIDKFTNKEIKTWIWSKEEKKITVYRCTQCGRGEMSKDCSLTTIQYGKTVF